MWLRVVYLLLCWFDKSICFLQRVKSSDFPWRTGTFDLMTGEQRFRCKSNEAAFTICGPTSFICSKHKGRSLSNFEMAVSYLRSILAPLRMCCRTCSMGQSSWQAGSSWHLAEMGKASNIFYFCRQCHSESCQLLAVKACSFSWPFRLILGAVVCQKMSPFSFGSMVLSFHGRLAKSNLLHLLVHVLFHTNQKSGHFRLQFYKSWFNVSGIIF